MKEKIRAIVWGTSGHARVVLDILHKASNVQVAGFLDDSRAVGESFVGLPIYGGAEALDAIRDHGVTHLVFGFGDPTSRLRLAKLAADKGYKFLSALHPAAVIADDVEIGPGSMVAAGVVVNPGAKIGNNVILNTSASIDHDCRIYDCATISPGARLAGAVEVGEAAWIGIGAVLIEKVRVGAGAVIGAGAVVLRDVPAGVVAYGVPARVVRCEKIPSERIK